MDVDQAAEGFSERPKSQTLGYLLKVRLREQPNNDSTIILLIPNSSYVTRVAGSSDVSAGGYNWVNIRYTDPNGLEAVGWAARDAMRDRTTLREEEC